MATKKLILRPIASTCPKESLVTLCPNDTTIDNAYKLINESTADNDSTYVTYAARGNMYWYFNYTKPEDLISVSEVNIKVTCKAESVPPQGSSVTMQGKIYHNNSLTLTPAAIAVKTTEYTELIHSWPSTDHLTFFNPDNFSPIEFYISQAIGTGNKIVPIRVTQTYIEIVYESSEENSETIYLKQNNVWDIINSQSIYLKSNNNWILSDSSILQNNTNYIIKEVDQ
jgi:hypothetical protein